LDSDSDLKALDLDSDSDFLISAGLGLGLGLEGNGLGLGLGLGCWWTCYKSVNSTSQSNKISFYADNSTMSMPLTTRNHHQPNEAHTALLLVTKTFLLQYSFLAAKLVVNWNHS